MLYLGLYIHCLACTKNPCEIVQLLSFLYRERKLTLERLTNLLEVVDTEIKPRHSCIRPLFLTTYILASSTFPGAPGFLDNISIMCLKHIFNSNNIFLFFFLLFIHFPFEFSFSFLTRILPVFPEFFIMGCSKLIAIATTKQNSKSKYEAYVHIFLLSRMSCLLQKMLSLSLSQCLVRYTVNNDIN